MTTLLQHAPSASASRSAGMTDAEAVRTASNEAAVGGKMRAAIREQVRAVVADEDDPEEQRIVCEQLAPRVLGTALDAIQAHDVPDPNA